MKITLKMFTFLGKYLPAGAARSQIILELPENISAGQLLNDLNVPRAECKILMINGIYVAPADADEAALKDGDVFSVFPQSTG